MTAANAAIAALLCIGVGTELVCCIGVLRMPTAFARIHYLAPATLFGTTAIAAAVVVDQALKSAGVKAILIAAILLIIGPVLAHATARAEWIRCSAAGTKEG